MQRGLLNSLDYLNVWFKLLWRDTIIPFSVLTVKQAPETPKREASGIPLRDEPAQLPPGARRAAGSHYRRQWAGEGAPGPGERLLRADPLRAFLTRLSPSSSWTSSWCGTGPLTWLTTGRPPPNTCGLTQAQPLRSWRSKCGNGGCLHGGAGVGGTGSLSPAVLGGCRAGPPSRELLWRPEPRGSASLSWCRQRRAVPEHRWRLPGLPLSGRETRGFGCDKAGANLLFGPASGCGEDRVRQGAMPPSRVPTCL